MGDRDSHTGGQAGPFLGPEPPHPRQPFVGRLQSLVLRLRPAWARLGHQNLFPTCQPGRWSPVFTGTALGLPGAQGARGAWAASGPGVDLPWPHHTLYPLWDPQEGPGGSAASERPSPRTPSNSLCLGLPLLSQLPSWRRGHSLHRREGAAGLRGHCALVSRFRQ